MQSFGDLFLRQRACLDRFAQATYMMEESGMEELFSTMEFSFKDGMVTQKAAGVTSPALEYEQDGKNITIGGASAEEVGVTLTVSGSKLIMEMTEEGVGTYKVTFKQK